MQLSDHHSKQAPEDDDQHCEHRQSHRSIVKLLEPTKHPHPIELHVPRTLSKSPYTGV